MHLKAAGADKLSQFGKWSIIDNLVIRHNGVYTHEDIFNLSYSEVMNILLHDKYKESVQARFVEIKESLNKRK